MVLCHRCRLEIVDAAVVAPVAKRHSASAGFYTNARGVVVRGGTYHVKCVPPNQHLKTTCYWRVAPVVPEATAYATSPAPAGMLAAQPVPHDGWTHF